MKYKEFDNPLFEQHFNTEMLRFWMALKAEAVKDGYPYIKYFLKDTLKQFKKMQKSCIYSPLTK
jgi:hypothetical protein